MFCTFSSTPISTTIAFNCQMDKHKSPAVKNTKFSEFLNEMTRVLRYPSSVRRNLYYSQSIKHTLLHSEKYSLERFATENNSFAWFNDKIFTTFCFETLLHPHYKYNLKLPFLIIFITYDYDYNNFTKNSEILRDGWE